MDLNPDYINREVPLWDMNMVFDLVSPWRWTSIQDSFHQIELPPTIVLCLWDWDTQIGHAAFPNSPEVYLARLREQFLSWWQRNLRYPEWSTSLPREIMGRRTMESDWYISKAPLKPDSVNRTIQGWPVLRINVSTSQLERKGAERTLWEGEFIATDD
jgi:hypothetical protein